MVAAWMAGSVAGHDKRWAVPRARERPLLNPRVSRRLKRKAAIGRALVTRRRMATVMSFARSIRMRLSPRMRKLAGILPWFALGPVTGPLAYRMNQCVKSGDRGLAALYGIAIIVTWLWLASNGGQALADLSQI
jgi:hypothetical protein